MANNRPPFFSTSGSYTSQNLIKIIDQVKDILHETFAYTFGEGKTLDQVEKIAEGKIVANDYSSHHIKLFHDVWKDLDTLEQVKNLNELLEKYKNINQTLEEYATKNLKQGPLQKDKLTLLFNIHRFLSLQRFHLQYFNNETSISQLSNRLDKIEGELKSNIEAKKFSADVKELKDKLMSLENSLALLGNALHVKYNFNNDGFKIENVTVNPTNFEVLLAQVDCLIDANGINDLTSELELAIKKSDQKSISKGKDILTAIIDTIDELQDRCAIFFSDQFKDVENLLKKISIQTKENKFNVGRDEVKWFVEFFSHVSAINGDANFGQGCGELKTLSDKINEIYKLDSIWNLDGLLGAPKTSSSAIKNCMDLLKDLSIVLQQFINPYVAVNLRFQQINKRCEILQWENKTVFNEEITFLMKVAQCLEIDKDFWKRSFGGLTMVQMDIWTHLKNIPETKEEFLKSFLWRHKKKMAAWGISGSSLSTALAIPLATTPYIWIILSLLFFPAVGALQGAGTDYLNEKKQTEEENSKLANKAKQLDNPKTIDEAIEKDFKETAKTPLLSHSHFSKSSYGTVKGIKDVIDLRKYIPFMRSSL